MQQWKQRILSINHSRMAETSPSHVIPALQELIKVKWNVEWLCVNCFPKFLDFSCSFACDCWDYSYSARKVWKLSGRHSQQISLQFKEWFFLYDFRLAEVKFLRNGLRWGRIFLLINSWLPLAFKLIKDIHFWANALNYYMNNLMDLAWGEFN